MEYVKKPFWCQFGVILGLLKFSYKQALYCGHSFSLDRVQDNFNWRSGPVSLECFFGKNCKCNVEYSNQLIHSLHRAVCIPVHRQVLVWNLLPFISAVTVSLILWSGLSCFFLQEKQVSCPFQQFFTVSEKTILWLQSLSLNRG